MKNKRKRLIKIKMNMKKMKRMMMIITNLVGPKDSKLDFATMHELKTEKHIVLELLNVNRKDFCSIHLSQLR